MMNMKVDSFTLNTNLIPALRREGIGFRYPNGKYNTLEILVTYKNRDICRVKAIQEVCTSYCYNVEWAYSVHAVRFYANYTHYAVLINDIKLAIKDLENRGDSNMKVKVESVDMDFTTASMINGPLESDYTIKVNVGGFDPNFSIRVKEAIEALNNERYIYYGGRGNGKTYNWRNEYQKERDKFEIKDVIFNNPATIVFWADGTKTVVKAENEPFDPEKGLAMAIAKKALGNNYNYYDVFKKYVGKYEKKQKKGDK